jgi:hypothetical protein
MQDKLDRLKKAYAERQNLDAEIKKLKDELAAMVAAASGKSRKPRAEKNPQQQSLPLNGAPS